jgi:hypothetical protein
VILRLVSRFWYIAPLLLAACTVFGASPTPVTSSWGTVIHLGQTEQPDAPALWTTQNRLTAVWIGADDTGIHQDIRTIDSAGISERVVLPLPPRNPRDQRIFPAAGDNLTVLWLDGNETGAIRLYAAVITPERQVERGPTAASEEATWRYAAAPNGDGSLWVVSSGGLVYAPGLYARYIDSEGRPRLELNSQIVSDGDWPALVKTNDGTTYLFWIQPSDGQVFRAVFADGQLTDILPVTTAALLNPGDQLRHFSAALDQTHFYLFWNIVRSNGEAETWFTSEQSNKAGWQQPVRLGITPYTQSFETAFNSGTARAADMGEDWVSWGMPLSGQFDVLPVAAFLNSGQLGIVYLKGGAVVGVQDITPVSRLLSLPVLTTDRDRFLYLAWSEPNNSGQADLKLTTSRRS